MDSLAFEKAEMKNKTAVSIPLGDGVRHLLTAYYDRARPLLVSRFTPANAPVFLTDQGRPFRTGTLAWMLSAHLREEIFGGIPVYPHFLRSLCVNLLIDGYRFEPPVVAGIIGDTVDVTMTTYRRLNPQEAAKAYRARLRRQPRDPAVDRLMADLDAWLEQLAADFSR